MAHTSIFFETVMQKHTFAYKSWLRTWANTCLFVALCFELYFCTFHFMVSYPDYISDRLDSWKDLESCVRTSGRRPKSRSSILYARPHVSVDTYVHYHYFKANSHHMTCLSYNSNLWTRVRADHEIWRTSTRIQFLITFCECCNCSICICNVFCTLLKFSSKLTKVTHFVLGCQRTLNKHLHLCTSECNTNNKCIYHLKVKSWRVQFLSSSAKEHWT